MRFSRSEWSILAGLILMVVSAVVPALRWVRQRADLRMVRADMQAVLEAGRLFYSEYGIWPSQYVLEQGDIRYGRDTPNHEVMNVLRSMEGGGNEGGSVNPNHIVFIDFGLYEPGRSGLNERGDLLDPWGIPYQMVLDTDLNAACDISDSLHGTGIPHGMIMWSCGPDRISDTPDDILSWR